MEIIIRNGTNYSLTNVISSELNQIKANNDEVITNIALSNLDKQKIYKGCILSTATNVIETPVYIKQYLEQVKKQKSLDVNKLATLSDQLNLLAVNLNLVLDEQIKTNPALATNINVVQGKKVLSGIQAILAK